MKNEISNIFDITFFDCTIITQKSFGINKFARPTYAYIYDKALTIIRIYEKFKFKFKYPFNRNLAIQIYSILI